MDLHLNFMELLNHGSSYDTQHRNDEYSDSVQNNFKGLMCFHAGDIEGLCDLRFGIRQSGKSLMWSTGWDVGDFNDIGDVRNQHFYNIPNLYDGNAHFVTLTLDTSQIYK